jgi:23S rRNA G2445 N2-methylase RlmL
MFLEAARWGQVTHRRDMLKRFEAESQQLELRSLAAACAAIREVRETPMFSVSASFVGKRNYSSNEIKAAVAAGVSARYPWVYTDDDRSAELNIRVFIEHGLALVGVRLSRVPLHERPYKQVQRPGSLKPPVAAAMLMLGGVRPGMRVLDPCCGAGTILIEAGVMGALPIGGDIEVEAAAASRANFSNAAVRALMAVWDARRLPLDDESVDAIVTNMPWGRQVTIQPASDEFYATVCGEMERVLRPGGCIAALAVDSERLTFSRLALEQSVEISLFGQTPTIRLYHK